MDHQHWLDTPIADAARRAASIRSAGKITLDPPECPRLITICNQKGGVGKTTTAVNFAASLAIAGMRVLVVDMDPQGNASTALDATHGVGTPSSYEVLLGEIAPQDAMQACPGHENLWCIPSTIDLAGAEIELVTMDRREYRLAEALSDDFLNDFDLDYVIIDCPPSLGLLTINAMCAVTEVLIPIQCEYYALEGVSQLLGSIGRITKTLNPALHISTIVLTMYDGRTKLAEQVADEVRRHFGDIVLKRVIPRSIKVSEAPGFGQTVLDYDPGSKGAVAYLDAALEFARRGDMIPGTNADEDQGSADTP